MTWLPLIIKIRGDKIESATAAFMARHPKPTDGPDAAITDQKWMEKILMAKMNREIELGQRALDMDKVKTEKIDYFEEE